MTDRQLIFYKESKLEGLVDIGPEIGAAFCDKLNDKLKALSEVDGEQVGKGTFYISIVWGPEKEGE